MKDRIYRWLYNSHFYIERPVPTWVWGLCGAALVMAFFVGWWIVEGLNNGL